MSGRLTPPVSDGDHTSGPADAPVTLLQYGDYECPFCRRAHPILNSIRRQMGGGLRFVYRHFPYTRQHPHAQHAAEMAEAAAVQGKFWEMHDLLFENQDNLEDNDLISYAARLGIPREWAASSLASHTFAGRVREDFRSGVRSGANGTPTFFINGVRYDGSWEEESAFLEALQAAASESVRR
jgi:protein-disulfide isomerase